MSKERQKGVTLIEMLIVVAVLGVLTAIAYPSYQSHVLEGHRTTAKADLMMWQLAFEEQRTQNQTYISSAAKTIQTLCPSCTNDDTRYEFTVSDATQTQYTLVAKVVERSPQEKDTACQTLTLAHTGETTPKDKGCW